MFNFKWQPVSAGIKFERLGHIEKRSSRPGDLGSTPQQTGAPGTFSAAAQSSTDKQAQQMVNHFECHHLISEKFHLVT